MTEMKQNRYALQMSKTVMDAYGKIVSNMLLKNTQGKPLNRKIVFTSSMPGEGTEDAVIASALALAGFRQKVLLVDADSRNPFPEEYFSTDNTVAAAKQSPNQIAHWDQLGIDLLVCRQETPGTFFDMDHFKKLLDGFCEKYDQILIRTSPVLSGPETEMVAKISDGVVLVLKQRRSNFMSVSRAKAALQDVGAKIIGCILSDYDYKRSNRFDEYYHYKQVNGL